MTIAQLNEYRYIAEQIEEYEEKYGRAYLSGIDTSKPSVQSGNTSDNTANFAVRHMSLYEREDYALLCRKKQVLDDYIFGIKDEELKRIFKLKFIQGMSYSAVAERVFSNKKTVREKIIKYLEKSNEIPRNTPFYPLIPR